MLLSAALIVRNEAGVLADCLASIRDVVDEIVLVDTGSTDATVVIARRFGARVLHHPWDGDFAAARNAGLEAARGNWILYIDADERLERGTRADVEALLEGRAEVAFRLKLRPFLHSTPYREYRIWRHDPRIRFQGRIHEKVTPAIRAVAAADRRPIADCELLLGHVGYEGDQTHKHRRNLPLLRAQLAREPGNLFNRNHLARVLAGLGRDGDAEAVLVETVALARTRPHDPAGAASFVDLTRARRARGEDVRALVAEARRLYPDNKLLWWLEADLLREAGAHEEALARYDALLAVDPEIVLDGEPAYDARIFGEYAHDGRGTCLFRLGRHREAAEAWAAAARLAPQELAYRSRGHVAHMRERTTPAAGSPA